MKFFGNFSFELEEKSLQPFIKDLGCYDVVGLGYGCFMAIEYVLEELNKQHRIQKAILISPIIDFLSYQEIITKTYKKSCLISLEDFDKKKQKLNNLESIVPYGVKLEVYIGSKTQDFQKMIDLFRPFGLIYCFREKGFDIFDQLLSFKQEQGLLKVR